SDPLPSALRRTAHSRAMQLVGSETTSLLRAVATTAFWLTLEKTEVDPRGQTGDSSIASKGGQASENASRSKSRLTCGETREGRTKRFASYCSKIFAGVRHVARRR